MPTRESPWLDRIGWALMAAGAVALFSLLWVAESRIERKERLIQSIMHRYGWSPAQPDRGHRRRPHRPVFRDRPAT